MQVILYVVHSIRFWCYNLHVCIYTVHWQLHEKQVIFLVSFLSNQYFTFSYSGHNCSVTCVLSLSRNKTRFLQRLLPNENHPNLPRDHSSLFQKLCEVCVWPVEVNWRLLMNVSLQNIISQMPSDKATPIQDILLILFVVNMVVSYLRCVLFYVHGPLRFIGRLYIVLVLGWVPVLMFLQLMDVYFDCESRNECCEKFGNKSAHLFYMYYHYIFKAMHYYFTIIDISSLFNKTNIKRKITVIFFFGCLVLKCRVYMLGKYVLFCVLQIILDINQYFVFIDWNENFVSNHISSTGNEMKAFQMPGML